ncbi:hypothetical protein [Aquiflexum sp.]
MKIQFGGLYQPGATLQGVSLFVKHKKAEHFAQPFCAEEEGFE